jgi:hypothetical protein
LSEAISTARAAEAVFFPLDEQLKLWEKHWSEGLAKEAVWVSGVVDSYAEAEAIMSRIGHVYMSDSTIWRRVQRWGEQFEILDQQRQVQALALPRSGSVIRGIDKRAGRLGTALDGAMVHLRTEGWKELKVGCLFEIESQPVWEPDTKEWLELGHAVNNSYIAHLGGPDLFGQLLWAEAQARGWQAVYDTQVLGDGAPWIWRLADEHFFDSRQTLDWSHASTHLHAAAQLIYPQDETKAQRWYHQAETTLFQGHADRLAEAMRQHATAQTGPAQALRTEANYFETHKRRMPYLELREEGYLLGSGMVESGAKQFKARFTGPGMRWSRPGLERLIPIRAAIMSHQFDPLWAKVYHSPLN